MIFPSLRATWENMAHNSLSMYLSTIMPYFCNHGMACFRRKFLRLPLQLPMWSEACQLQWVKTRGPYTRAKSWNRKMSSWAWCWCKWCTCSACKQLESSICKTFSTKFDSIRYMKRSIGHFGPRASVSYIWYTQLNADEGSLAKTSYGLFLVCYFKCSKIKFSSST